MNEEYGGARRGAGRRMLHGILLGQIMLMNMGLVNSRDVVTSRSQCVQGRSQCYFRTFVFIYTYMAARRLSKKMYENKKTQNLQKYKHYKI